MDRDRQGNGIRRSAQTRLYAARSGRSGRHAAAPGQTARPRSRGVVAGASGLAFPAHAGAQCLRDRDSRRCFSHRSRIIASTPKPPSSPARHAPKPRKRATRPASRTESAAATLGSPRKKTIAAGPSDEVKAAVRKTPRSPRTKKAEPSKLDQTRKLILDSLEDDKAIDIVTLDMTGKAMFCDNMIIASGLADRQIAAMAQHLREKLHAAGMKRVQIEGLGASDWVLIDAGDVVVHLFMPDARAMYGLEKMWGQDLDAPAPG